MFLLRHLLFVIFLKTLKNTFIKEKYSNKRIGEEKPHIFAISDNAYTGMMATKKDQVRNRTYFFVLTTKYRVMSRNRHQNRNVSAGDVKQKKRMRLKTAKSMPPLTFILIVCRCLRRIRQWQDGIYKADAPIFGGGLGSAFVD